MAGGMIDTLGFKMFLDDKEFNERIKADEAAAKRLNITVSQYLELRQKVNGLSAAEARAIKTKQQEILIQQRIATETERTAAAEARAAKTKLQLEQATRRAAEAQKRLNTANKSTNSSFSLQGRLISNLTTLGTAYVSIFAAERFVSNLARVSGEFELQRISLRAILQDVQGADRLFSQIKKLSVESPFQFKELVSYAKQLSAFSVPLSELYDTTKRLADVSSGLGVDMGRIILAYGQVRSAAVLRGQELRQFTEAGIPLVDQLAKKFSELEGRVVSAGEVFEKISNRMVPFQMVKDIFTDLTSEGGMFYQMQEKQAESLAGKISNLADAYDIMLSDIGEANEGILKGGVDLIAELFQNWEEVGQWIEVALAAFTGYVLMTKSYNAYLKISLALEKQMVVVRRAAAISNKELTASQIKSAAASRLLNKNLAGLSTAGAYGLVAAGILGIGTAIYNAYQNSQKLRKELEKINSGKFVEANKLVNDFERLANEIIKTNDGSMRQNELMQKLKRTYGEYLDVNNLTVESLRQMAGAYDNVTQAIYDKAKADAYEKGMQTINEDYNEKAGAAVEKLRKILSKEKGITEIDAQNIISIYVDRLEQGIKGGMETFSKVVNDYFGKKIYSYNELAPSDSLLDIYKNGLSDLTDAYNSYVSSVEEFNRSQDVLFTKAQTRTKEEAEAIQIINETYDHLEKQAKSTLGENQGEDVLARLEIVRLEDLKKYYQTVADALKKQGKSFDYQEKKIQALDAKIASLTEKTVLWRDMVKEATEGNDAAKAFSPLQDERLPDYIERVRNGYKSLKNEIATLTGVKGAEETLNSARRQMEAIEIIAKALNFSLSTEKGGSEAVKKLEEELKTLQSVYDQYLKLTEEFGPQQAAKQVKDIYGIDFESEGLQDRAKKILSQIEEESKASAEKARKAWDMWFGKKQAEQIIANFKYAVSKVEAEFNRFEKDLALYRQLTEAGVSDTVAQNVAFGVKIDGRPDEVKKRLEGLQEILKESFKGVYTGEIKLSADTPLLDQIEAMGLILSPEQKSEIAESQEYIDGVIRQRIAAALAFVAERRSIEEKIKDIENKAEADIEENKGLIGLHGYSQEDHDKFAKETREKAREQIDELRSQGVELTDFWRTLFGDLDDLSFSKIMNLMKETDKIIEAANKEGNQIKDPVTGEIKGYKVEIDGKQTQITVSQLDQLIKKFGQLKKVINPNGSLGVAIDNFWKALKGDGKGGEKRNVAEFLGDVSQAVGELGAALHNAGLIDEDAAQIFQGVADAGMGIAKIAANPSDVTGYVQAVMGLVGVFGSLFNNDRKLQKQIEKSERAVKRLENAYADLEHAVENSVGTGVYDLQAQKIKNLRQQQKELYTQLDLERRKKDSDEDKLISIEGEIEDIGRQMSDIITEVRNDIIGGTAKDIAAQLSDAFVEAFKNGEDAAGAWHDKVDELVGDITKRMLTQKFLEEPIKSVFDKYGRIWNIEAGGDVASRVLDSLPDLKNDLNKTLGIWADVFESLSPELKDLLTASNEAGDSLKSGIQGVTEDTASIIASYLNAMRQSALERNQILKIIADRVGYNRDATTLMLASMKAIELNTRNTAEAALRAANAAENILSGINSVVAPNKSGAGNAINVNA